MATPPRKTPPTALRLPALLAQVPGRGAAGAFVCCYLTQEGRRAPVLVDAATGAAYPPGPLAGRPVEVVVRGEAEYALARRGREAGYAIRIEHDNRTRGELQCDEWGDDPGPPG